MKIRAIAAAALAVTLLTGTAGCGLFVESATLKPYAASDGINANVGNLMVRDVLLITTGDGSAWLLGTVVNNSSSAERVTIELAGVDNGTRDVTAGPGGTKLGNSMTYMGSSLFSNTGLLGGELADVYFQYGNSEGVTVSVPVLDGTDPANADYLPASAISY